MNIVNQEIFSCSVENANLGYPRYKRVQEGVENYVKKTKVILTKLLEAFDIKYSIRVKEKQRAQIILMQQLTHTIK